MYIVRLFAVYLRQIVLHTCPTDRGNRKKPWRPRRRSIASMPLIGLPLPGLPRSHGLPHPPTRLQTK